MFFHGPNILGPFPQASSKLKFLIIALDNFTKWVKVEALAKITTANVLKFFKINILAKFKIPQAIVINNGTQLPGKNLKALLEELRVRQHFTSVVHPGQENRSYKLGVPERVEENAEKFQGKLER